MRHGVLFSCQDPDGSSIGASAVYDACLAQAIDADRQGYDWVNVTEHHVTADGYLPALLTLLAGVATVTDASACRPGCSCSTCTTQYGSPKRRRCSTCSAMGA